MSETVIKVVLGLGMTTGAAGATYDLRTQWSDTSNPNGVWTYREGVNVLPHVDSYLSFAYSQPQPGWARAGDGNMRTPFWERSQGHELFFSNDYLPGDVVVFAQDPTYGVGQGAANVLWTSPDATPFASITGAVWMGREEAPLHWAIYKNATLLTEGDIFAGDPYNRAAPFNFAAGSGGPAALSNIPIVPGDGLEFRIFRTTADGATGAVNFTVTTGLPEPATAALLTSGSILLLSRRAQRR